MTNTIKDGNQSSTENQNPLITKEEWTRVVKVASAHYKKALSSNPHYQARMNDDNFWFNFVSSQIVAAKELVDRLDAETASKNRGQYDPSNLPPALVDAIVALAELPEIKSFSLPFTDAALWERLVKAQVRKAELEKIWPYEAIHLIATGGPIPGFRDDIHRTDFRLGGEIAVIPMDDEGIHPGDVYASKYGIGLDLETVASATNLSQAVFYYDPWYIGRNHFCKIFLTPTVDAGEIRGTTREVIGNWSLYRATDLNYIDALKPK